MAVQKQNKTMPPEQLFADAHDHLKTLRNSIKTVIFGQDSVVDLTLTTLLSGGHGLLVGVPGLAKTLLVETIATAMGLSSSRVQCTPDLMPSDILGSEILDEDTKGKRHFRFIEGPIFAQFLMVDEINRASPRTQSALLQAMQEQEVSIAGKAHALPKPFHVLATQNPIEQEGTYPLPEAQLDRFMMQIDVTYPDLAAEKEILLKTTTGSLPVLKSTITAQELIKMQTLVRDMPIGEQIVNAILSIVRNARPSATKHSDYPLVNRYVLWPPGPRAAQTLMLTCRAKALLDGREAPSIDDVIGLAEPVMKHRMALSYQAQADGVTIQDILADLTRHV